MAFVLFAAVALLFVIADDFYLRWQIRQYSEPESAAEAEETGETTAKAEENDEPAEIAEAAETTEIAEPEPIEEAEEFEEAAKTAEIAVDAPAAGTLDSNAKSRILAAVLGVPIAFGLALVSYLVYGNSAEYTVKLLCVFEMLIPIGILDKRFNRIPNRVIVAGLVLFVGFFLFELLAMHEPLRLLLREAFFGLLLGGGVFALCGIVSRSGMGAGDIKLFAVLGLLMTWRGVFNMIFFSVLLIAAYGLFHLATKRMTKESQIPMGPFVLTAMGIVILLGI